VAGAILDIIHKVATTFAEVAANVIGRAEVPIAVLLVTLVYINRPRPHLFVEAEEWAFHRVFLGVLILASKVRLSDHHPTLAENPDPYPFDAFRNPSSRLQYQRLPF
jgi:hypothetical protein